MKCFICDQEIDNPSIDVRDGKFKPCFTCESVVNDTIREYDVRVDDLSEGLYQPLEEFLEEEDAGVCE